MIRMGSLRRGSWRLHATIRDLQWNRGPGPYVVAYASLAFDAPSDGWAHDVLAAIRQAIEDPAFDYRIGVTSSAELAGKTGPVVIAKVYRQPLI